MSRQTAIAVAALGFVLVGCTAQGANPDGDTVASSGAGPAEVAERYGYDIDASVGLTPVYALVPEYSLPEDGYARDLLARECLAGVVDYRVTPPSHADRFTDARTGQPIFDVQVATESGYPFLRRDPLAAEGQVISPDVEITDAIDEKMHACGEQADERLGQPPVRLLSEIAYAGWQRVETDGRVADAVERWHACMAPVGVVDLPEDIGDMPSPSVLGGAAANRFVPDTDVPLTEREREVAVADATCREEVQYPQTVHRVRAEAELEMIGRNLDAFDAVRSEYEDYQAGVEKVIAELG